MAAQGQSFFAASGDDGDWEFYDYVYPAEDANVISVGGTSLTTSSPGGPWNSETGWVYGGGGISPDRTAIPSWQQLSGVISSSNEGSTLYRNVPDVSANADFTFYVCADQAPCTANDYGGTSFAAPIWAGYMALANQQAVARGDSTLGFIIPAIYSIGLSSTYDTDFHDIAIGNNGFPAVAGYDLVSGWGSPNGANLINSLTVPNLALILSAESLSVPQGNFGTLTISSTPLAGFNADVALTATGQPTGATVSFSPASIAAPGTGSSTMTVAVDSTTQAGMYTITVSAKGAGVTQTTTVPLIVTGPATHLALTASATETYSAGAPFSFQVTAEDQNNNIATNYSGTVHFTSSDVQAVLPPNSTLTKGAGAFSATLNTVGSQTITASDTATGSVTGSASISVVRGAAAAPTFSPAPGTFTVPQSVTLADSTPGVTIYYTTMARCRRPLPPSTRGRFRSQPPPRLTPSAGGDYGLSTVARGTYTIMYPPDLIESSVTGPTSGAAGGAISVTDTTINQGAGAASAFYTMFYLSTDGTTKGAMLTYRFVDALAAGGSSSATTSMTLPANTTGTNYVLVCANNSNSPIVETNTANNCTASAAFTVAGADLIESSVTGPSTGVAGGTISVTDTTNNQGGGAASASYTMFYLSADGKTKGSMLTYRSVAALASGASSTATTSMTLPANTTGTNYVLVCANNGNSPIVETNTANNCTASAAFTVAGADLIEISVTGPSTGVAGGTISVTDTTNNQGGGTAGASYTMYYLSTDGKMKGTMLTYRSVASLASGASSSATTSMTLPANVTGTNYVLVCANSSNNPIVETNYANDCTASAAFTVSGPDLIESSVTGPASGVAGATISVTDTTTNQGAGATSASYTMFYLSSDGTTKGVMLSYRSVATLVAGASSSATTSMILPTNITGTNYVLVCANGSNSPVLETDSANDCTASAAFTISH